jgi:hypothetical protein
MEAEITIKNYRCFVDSAPARVLIRDGFTAFLGVNNSGKSSILRFFYDFRQLFALLTPGNPQAPIQASKDQPMAFTPPPGMTDLSEMFTDYNNRGIELTIAFPGHTPPERFVLKLP